MTCDDARVRISRGFVNFFLNEHQESAYFSDIKEESTEAMVIITIGKISLYDCREGPHFWRYPSGNLLFNLA